jgi:hypothetical protein
VQVDLGEVGTWSMFLGFMAWIMTSWMHQNEPKTCRSMHGQLNHSATDFTAEKYAIQISS